MYMYTYSYIDTNENAKHGRQVKFYVCVYMYMYIYVRARTHTHTHTHIDTNKNAKHDRQVKFQDGDEIAYTLKQLALSLPNPCAKHAKEFLLANAAQTAAAATAKHTAAASAAAPRARCAAPVLRPFPSPLLQSLAPFRAPCHAFSSEDGQHLQMALARRHVPPATHACKTQAPHTRPPRDINTRTNCSTNSHMM